MEADRIYWSRQSQDYTDCDSRIGKKWALFFFKKWALIRTSTKLFFNNLEEHGIYHLSKTV